MNFAERAREIANGLPLAQRLAVLARFGFMQMTAGNAEAAREIAGEIDDGLQIARDFGDAYPEAATELDSLDKWIEASAQEKPDPRREGIDLADQILARPHALPKLTEAIRSGRLPSVGSRTVGDAAEELYRRGEHRHARTLLDGVAGSETGHRARLRAGLLLKREPVSGVDPERLVTEAVADAARMDRADGKSARRQFLAGVALMSFDEVDVADGIMRQLHGEGHTNLSAGVKQRLARGLLDAGRAEDAMGHLASIRSDAARELATAAVLEHLIGAAGLPTARALAAPFRAPAAVASARAKLAERAALEEPGTAHADLASAIGAMAALRESDPFFYPALCDVLSAYAAVDGADVAQHAAVASLLGAEGPFPAYRLRLAEHLAGALVKHSRQRCLDILIPQLDGDAAAVMLMRASLP